VARRIKSNGGYLVRAPEDAYWRSKIPSALELRIKMDVARWYRGDRESRAVSNSAKMPPRSGGTRKLLAGDSRQRNQLCARDSGGNRIALAVIARNLDLDDSPIARGSLRISRIRHTARNRCVVVATPLRELKSP